MNSTDIEKTHQTVALARFAAVSWIEEQIKNGNQLSFALSQAADRVWGQKKYAIPTLEEWIYLHRRHGFQGLLPRGRSDRGTIRSLSPQVREALERVRREHPGLSVRSLVEHLIKQGVLEVGRFSYPSIYRWLRRTGLDPRTLRREMAIGSGPTKAFEAALANDIWMADMMHGLVLKTAEGRTVRTRLFAIIDDCSRVCVGGQYYASESLVCLMDVFKGAVARRGVPSKLYVDLGKVFVSHHLQVVCANLGCKLSHAKPYHCWSKGKIEKFFSFVQSGFQQQLALSPVHSLDELNQRFWQWMELEYHQRLHSAIQTTPAQRFTERSQALRTVADVAELDQLFLMRQKRRVRKDATISLLGQLWEVNLALRSREVEVRFNPFQLQKVEIHFAGKLFCLARRCNKQLNARTFHNSSNYED
jgi:transposase InsO family protein